MDQEEKERRIGLFLQLVERISLKDSVDSLYKLVCKFDTPKSADRDFVYECLIAHYKELEEYEKCAKLLKLQKNKNRKPKITSRGLSIDDVVQLQTLRFDVPDKVILEVLAKKKNSASPNKGD